MPIRPHGETGETCLSLREVVLCVHAHPPTTQEEAARQSFSEHVGWGSPRGGRADGPSWVGGRPRGIRHLPHLWDPCGHVGAAPLMGGGAFLRKGLDSLVSHGRGPGPPE